MDTVYMERTLALSRTALEQFIRCPRCFYLQRRLGLKPPAMVPLTLAVATDALLKNEFDAVRRSKKVHPLWTREKLNVRAFNHPEIDIWRNNFKGIRVPFPKTDYEIFGAVDDVWISQDTNELHIVDYKSTSKSEEPSLDGEFGDGYKRQMEIYQWLFKRAGFNVSDVGYFLYVNASKKTNFYDNQLNGNMRFVTKIIEYVGSTDWVYGSIADAISCLEHNSIPIRSKTCDTCRYYAARLTAEASIEEAK